MPSLDELAQRLASARTSKEIAEIERLIACDRGRFTVGTLGEVAELVGVALQTCKEWRVGPNPMPGTEGCWDMIDIFRWRYDRLLRTSSANQKSAEVESLELRILTAKAAAVELDVLRERGELVLRTAAKSEVEKMFNVARAHIEGIPGEVAVSLPPELRADISHQWSQQIALILRKMAQNATAVERLPSSQKGT